MTVIDDVYALIDRLAPEALCDDCVAERLRLSVRQHANHKTQRLAGSNGIKWRKDTGSMCFGEKLIIRRVK